MLRLLPNGGPFYDKLGGSLVGQDFLDFLPLLLLTLQGSRTAGCWGSVVRNLCMGSVGWAAGGTAWSPKAVSGICKLHHGFSQVTTMMMMTTVMTYSFCKGRTGKSVQQHFPPRIIVKNKSVLVWLPACVLITVFSPWKCWWDLMFFLLNSVEWISEGAMEFK